MCCSSYNQVPSHYRFINYDNNDTSNKFEHYLFKKFGGEFVHKYIHCSERVAYKYQMSVYSNVGEWKNFFLSYGISLGFSSVGDTFLNVTPKNGQFIH